MTWMTWRQFRTQAWMAIAALAAIAITYAATRPSLTHLYSASGISACQAHGDCGRLAASFISHVRADGAYPVLYAMGVVVMYLVPAIIGMFWGAPLITHELEAGTYRLPCSGHATRRASRRVSTRPCPAIRPSQCGRTSSGLRWAREIVPAVREAIKGAGQRTRHR